MMVMETLIMVVMETLMKVQMMKVMVSVKDSLLIGS